MEPDILLVDEVLAVGDKVFSEKCRNVFRKLKSEGRTIILVSHDMNAVKEFCNRVIVMNDGQIMEQGKPAEMVTFYNQNILKIAAA